MSRSKGENRLLSKLPYQEGKVSCPLICSLSSKRLTLRSFSFTDFKAAIAPYFWGEDVPTGNDSDDVLAAFFAGNQSDDANISYRDMHKWVSIKAEFKCRSDWAKVEVRSPGTVFELEREPQEVVSAPDSKIVFTQTSVMVGRPHGLVFREITVRFVS